MLVRFILQARFDSSRLPGKALLPVAGYPAAILAALRAGRDGTDTVLATTARPCDDPIAAAADAYGIKTFRGDRDDVLGRFRGACADLPDDAIAVRLTCDNTVPDCDYGRSIVDKLLAHGGDYYGTEYKADGLPDGISAEAMPVGALRRSHRLDRSPQNLEHVTTFLRRGGQGPRLPSDSLHMAHLRCTLDTPEDYRRVMALFDGVADPIGVSWRDLLARLATLPAPPDL